MLQDKGKDNMGSRADNIFDQAKTARLMRYRLKKVKIFRLFRHIHTVLS